MQVPTENSAPKSFKKNPVRILCQKEMQNCWFHFCFFKIYGFSYFFNRSHVIIIIIGHFYNFVIQIRFNKIPTYKIPKLV